MSKGRGKEALAMAAAILVMLLLAVVVPLDYFLVRKNESKFRTAGEVSWLIEKDVLTIRGEGPISDYARYSDTPWHYFDYTELVIEEGVTGIGSNAFSGSGVKTVTLPASVAAIGARAFYNCQSLRKVALSRNVRAIGANAFSYTSSLTSFSVEEENEAYWSDRKALYTKDRSTLLQYAPNNKAAAYVISAQTRTLESLSFAGTKNLTSLVLLSEDPAAGAREDTFSGSSLQTVYCRDSIALKGQLGESLTWKDPREAVGLVSLEDAQIELRDGQDVIYDGSEKTPAVRVVLGLELREGQDYTVSYSKNVKAGEATVKIKGINLYTGSAKDRFTIRPASLEGAVIGEIERQVYTGESVTPSPVVQLGSKTLKEGKNYTLSYKKNRRSGVATVVITGMGNYTGEAAKEFIIYPQATAITALDAEEGTVTLAWNQAPEGTGYLIQYSSKKSFRKPVEIQETERETTQRKIEGLESGKTYYFRVCVYRAADGKQYCSDWSEEKKITLPRSKKSK